MYETVRFALFMGLAIVAAVAGSNPARADKPRHAAMIVDANSGKVLHASNADELRYPASLTKMMTIYLAFEEIERGRLSLETALPVSEAAHAVAPSKLGLEPGSTIELADAIKALVTKSANDMAVAIAERIGGTESNFATLMTRRARELGMSSTTFRNASGLPDTEQVTTARDMITLALKLHDQFPDKVRVFKLRAFTYGGKTYRSHNTLMQTFSGMDGMKTGYTKMSGFNLVTSVHRDGKFLIGAVFGGATASSRNAHMRQILTKALDDASTEKTRKSKPQLIASARPADRPQAKPEKPVVNASTAPKPIKAPAAVVKPAAVAPSPITVAKREPPAQQNLTVAPPAPSGLAIADQAITVTPPAPAAKIEVAKVRTVSMSGMLADDGAAATQPSITVMPPVAPAAVEASAANALDFGALRRAVASTFKPTAAPSPAALAAADETIITKQPGRKPSTLQAQANASGLIPVAVESSSPARAPSTLDEQAASLAQAAQPPRMILASSEPQMRLQGPAQSGLAAAPASTGGRFAVQIGAYSTANEAERQMSAAQAKATTALVGASPYTRQVDSSGKPLFAARFLGFDQKQASNACNELRRQSFDCFVLQAK